MVYPLLLVTAIYICIIVYINSNKYDLSCLEWIKDSSIYCFVGAVIVGKLIYMATRIFQNNNSFIDYFNGFVFYGGFIGAILGLFIFSLKHNARLFDILDTYASLLPLGQAIGRVGCYFNGCCYGKEYYGLFSVDFIVAGEKIKVFPTWFFESFFCLILFISFFCISKKLFSGIYTSIYMLAYALFRFVIEIYRGDLVRGIWNGLSTSQYISIVVFIMGIIFLGISLKLKEKNLLIIGRDGK